MKAESSRCQEALHKSQSELLDTKNSLKLLEKKLHSLLDTNKACEEDLNAAKGDRKRLEGANKVLDE